MTEKQTKIKRTIPLKLGILLLITAIASVTALAIGATQNFRQTLPVVADIQFVPATIRIDGIDLGPYYDSATNRFTQCDLNITNYGSAPLSLVIEFWIKDQTQKTIASGSNTGTISAGENSVFWVTLNWQAGYTLANYTKAQTSVTATPK